VSIGVNKSVKSLIKVYVRAGEQIHVCMHGEYLSHTHTACMPAVSFEAIQRLVVLRELAEMHDMR